MANPENASVSFPGLDALLNEVALRAARAVLAEMDDRPSTTPGLIDTNALAAALSVTPKTVGKFRREGMPYTRIGAAPRYVLADCLAWFSAR